MLKSLFYFFIIFIIVVFFTPIVVEIAYYYFGISQLSIIRDVARTVFGTKESFFEFIAAVLIGPSITIPLIWQLMRDKEKDQTMKGKLASGLEHEISKNIQTVFQGEMEDMIETDVYKKVKANLHLVNIEGFSYISNLYRFSRSYQNIVKTWRSIDPQLAAEKFTRLKLQYGKFLSIQLEISDFKAKYYDDFWDMTQEIIAAGNKDLKKRDELRKKVDSLSRLLSNIYKNHKNTINSELHVFIESVFR